MAVNTTITLVHGNESYATITSKLLHAASNPIKQFQAMRNFFHAVAGGDRIISAAVQVTSSAGVKASATATLSGSAAADTCTVSGTVFTCVDHREKTDITFAADSGGSLNSKWFKFQDQSGLYKYYAWFNINSAGVDPEISGRTGIKITGATGATAATLATAFVTATAGTTSAKITFGADSAGSLNNTYIKFYDVAGQNRFAFWFNINNAGTAPSVPGYTLIRVNGATNASAATLATAAYTAWGAGNYGGFTVTNPSSGVVNIYGIDGVAAIVKDSVATPTNFVVVQSIHGAVVSAGASGHAIIQNVVEGVATATADGTATSTGFTFTHSITGSALTVLQYQLCATDTLTAVSLTNQINAHADLKQVVTATSAGAVVTVSSFYPGPVGNYITLTATAGVTASGAVLANGAVASSASAVTTYHMGV